MQQFEEMLFSVEEFADTRLSTFNEIKREEKGRKFRFSDVCQAIVLHSDAGPIQKVSPSTFLRSY